MRTWTAMNGSTMEAAFIKYEEPNVHMQKRDGTILKVNRDNLSDEDWVYVMQFDPSIFSLWIKLGEPTEKEMLYLKHGELPKVYKDDPFPRRSVFISSDGRMCYQDSYRAISCMFPFDESFFDLSSYQKREQKDQRWGDVKVSYFKSVYKDNNTGHLSSSNQDTIWLYNISYRFDNGFILKLNPKSSSIQYVNLMEPTTNRETCQFEMYGFANIHSLRKQRKLAEKEQRFLTIPRYRRIDAILHAKNAGAPKEAFIPPAAKNLTSTGSGFFISQDGYFLTNYHVVKGSQKIQLMTSAGVVKARVVRIEPDVDLALLKAESGTYSTLSFAQSMTPTLGEDIFTIGFPMPDIQGFSPKMTKGVISSLNGIQDEDLEYQIDASIQPGNSGGPLVNNNGELVGVIVSSLRDSYIAEKKGIIPQNVNYAIKAKHVIDFLGQVPDCHKQITFSNQPKIQTSATPETIENVQSACAMVMVFE